MTKLEFVLALERAFGKRLDPDQADAMMAKIARFSRDQLQQICDRIVEKEKYFPKIGHVFEAASNLGFLEQKAKELLERHWQMYTVGAYRYARPIKHPPGPEIPEKAVGYRLIIPPDEQQYEPCGIEEGKKAFNEAYLAEVKCKAA